MMKPLLKSPDLEAISVCMFPAIRTRGIINTAGNTDRIC